MGDDVHDVNDSQSQSSVGSAALGKPLKIEYSRPFFLVASKSGRVMDAKGAENGAQIQLWDKNGSESQRWVLETDGYIYQLGIRMSSRCGRKETGSKSSCWTRASPSCGW